MVETKITKEESYHLISVTGDVDASSSIELDNALKEASENATKILVDLNGLEYISSAGLGVFISYLEELKSKNIKLVLYGMKAAVLEVFQILGLQNLILIVSTKEEGIELINEK
ncbi:MAG: STAS domain-containing protein [Cyclobacteriaceae bacterium]